jgi:dienelactone hydrolase
MYIDTPNPVPVKERRMDPDRLIHNGLDYIDFQNLMKEVNQGANYAETCNKLGDADRIIAESALSNGHILTARKFFLNASAAFRTGQYPLVEDTDDKLLMYRKLIDCFAEAAKLFHPVIERVLVPYDGYELPCWLMMPESFNGECPVVISLGGADGWREEHHVYGSYYTERGMAYLLAEIPGQGETRLFNKKYMPVEVEEPINAIINYMCDDPRFGGNVGLVGYSFGGYLILRGASYSDRLKACCAVGGSYAPKEILNTLPNFMRVFRAVTGKSDTEIAEMLERMNMQDKLISCPLLIVHGGEDKLFSVEGVRRIYNEATNDKKTIRIWEDGNHCCTNHHTEVTSFVADWFADILLSK